MATQVQCTAPVRGHKTVSQRLLCPACKPRGPKAAPPASLMAPSAPPGQRGYSDDDFVALINETWLVERAMRPGRWSDAPADIRYSSMTHEALTETVRRRMLNNDEALPELLVWLVKASTERETSGARRAFPALLDHHWSQIREMALGSAQFPYEEARRIVTDPSTPPEVMSDAVRHPRLTVEDLYAAMQVPHPHIEVVQALASRKEEVPSHYIVEAVEKMRRNEFLQDHNRHYERVWWTIASSKSTPPEVLDAITRMPDQSNAREALRNDNTPVESVVRYFREYPHSRHGTGEHEWNVLTKRFGQGIPQEVIDAIVASEATPLRTMALDHDLVTDPGAIRAALKERRKAVRLAAYSAMIRSNATSALFGVDSDNKEALKMITETPGWEDFTPESVEVRLALMLYPNIKMTTPGGAE